MATNIVQMKDGSGNNQYPVTSAEAVGMPDGSGNLQTYLNKRVTELNISVLYPTNGEGGTNKYTLAGAIAQVPAEYRKEGVKVLFINESSIVETWEWQGLVWNSLGFEKIGGDRLREIDAEISVLNDAVKLTSFNQLSYSGFLQDKAISTSGQIQNSSGRMAFSLFNFGESFVSCNVYELYFLREDESVISHEVVATTKKANIPEGTAIIRGYTTDKRENVYYLYYDADVTEYVEHGISKGEYEAIKLGNKIDSINTKVDKNTNDINNNNEKILNQTKTLGKILDYIQSFSIPSVVVGGNISDDRNIVKSNTPVDVDDFYLKSISCDKIIGNTGVVNLGSQLKLSVFLYYNKDTFLSNIQSNTDKQTLLELYVYSKHKDFPDIVEFYSTGKTFNASTVKIIDTLSECVKRYIIVGDNSNVTGSEGYFYISAATTAQSEYLANEYGITGFRCAILDKNYNLDSFLGIQPDWITIDDYFFPRKSEIVDLVNGALNNKVVLQKIEDFTLKGDKGTDYNFVKHNQEQISFFIEMYKKQFVDEYNRLTVSMNGDSIIGSQLDDITHSDEYDTGDFPPNMSKMIMARKFFDKYKFEGEDTVFRNLIHSDWNKNGFNVSNGKGDKSQTFNEIEVYGCNSESEFAEITVTGFKFFKLVWSEYKDNKPYSFDILVDIDNGGYKTPSASGIKLPDTVEVTNSRRVMLAYKICKLDSEKNL